MSVRELAAGNVRRARGDDDATYDQPIASEVVNGDRRGSCHFVWIV